MVTSRHRSIGREHERYVQIIIAREGRAKVLFLFIKYAKFVALSTCNVTIHRASRQLISLHCRVGRVNS